MSIAPSQLASNSAILWSRGWPEEGPVQLQFPLGWGQGKVFDWYKRRRSTAISRIQLRKEFGEPFRHEFIVVILQGGDICRLDRRGDPEVPTHTLNSTGSDAHDTVQVIPSLDSIEPASECLVELRPNGKIDLLFILSICFGIHSDPKAQRYTLQRFNCYFFSWTITSIVARHSISWDTPLQPSTSGQLIEVLKKKGVDPIVKKSTEMGVKSISALFGSTIRPKVRGVLRKHLRPAGLIPSPILNLAFAIWMSRRMKPRMKSLLRNLVESAVTTTLDSTIESMLTSQSLIMRSALSHTLWFDSIRETLGRTARVALRDAVWAIVVKAFRTRGFNDASAQDAPPTSAQSSTKFPADRTSLDPGSPANTCLSTSEVKTSNEYTMKPRVGGLLDWFFVPGMIAITDYCYGRGVASSCWGMSDLLTGDAQTYEEWSRDWERVWHMVFEHARTRAQTVMSEVVRTEPPHAARDELWGMVWEELELGFQSSSPIVRDCLWEAFEFATATIVDVASDTVFAALREHPQYTLEATLNRIPDSSGKSKDVARVAQVNHTKLQEWIKYRIQKHGDQIGRLGLGSTTNVQNDICEAMDRVWKHVSSNEKGVQVNGASLPNTPTL